MFNLVFASNSKEDSLKVIFFHKGKAQAKNQQRSARLSVEFTPS